MQVNQPAVLAALASLLAIASPARAGAPEAGGPDKPLADREPDAADVATTPVTDLNLRKDEIPPVLLAAQADPYDLGGLGRCARIAAAIAELDLHLGDDIDLPRSERNGISAGRVAQSVVGSFIPFRGVIREISGANSQERRLGAAIQAGVARRAFLKGVGQQRGCRYPARPATPAVIDARREELRREAERDAQGPSGDPKEGSAKAAASMPQ